MGGPGTMASRPLRACRVRCAVWRKVGTMSFMVRKVNGGVGRGDMTVSEPGETREWVAYVGSRTTTARGAQGKGLSMYSVDAVPGVWRLRQVVEGLVNPSYMILNRAQDRLYAVHGDQTEASSFVVERDDGTLRFLNRQSCGGANPVHLELSMDERRLVVANYATGTLSSLGIAGDGALEPVAALLGLPGK